MSYKAQIQFSLHLHTFKNIQIDRQGYAAIRIQIYDESAPNINYALPYNIVPYHKAGLVSRVAEPSIEDNAVNSSTVKIQYADEKYFINDIVQFKMLVQSVPKLETNKLYVKFTLLFCSLHSYSNSMDPLLHNMEETVLKLENIQNGIFHYYQSQFTQNYASCFGFTLFAMITDFKLFPYSMRKQVITQSQQQRKRQKQRQKVSQIEDLFIWSIKYIKSCKEPLQYFYNTFAKILRYNSYLLKVRVNQFLKNKKQLQLKLPKFYKKEQVATSKQFYQFFSNFDQSQVSMKNYQDQIRQLHQQNYFFTQQVSQNMSKGLFDNAKIQNQYKDYVQSQSLGRLITQPKFGQQLANTTHANQTITIANKIRKQNKQAQPYPIAPSVTQPQQYLFHQICYKSQLKGKQIQKIKNSLPFHYDQRNMLVFLCHGFQASSYDMKIIQRGIKQALPLAQVVISCANQGDTEGDIAFMGKKLAKQVALKIKTQGVKNEQVIINFVGHSMGGIIARASLQHLNEYEKQFGFFCSLSSPHLGYLNGTDGMIKAGLWVMRKMMKQSKSLDQLSMSDYVNPRQTFMYNLSIEGNLKCFHKIILISSAEDNYVPWHSARICGYDSKKNPNNLEIQMAKNIIGDSNIHRIDVNFACQKGDLDGFIGRKAHINMIVNETIFKHINAVIPKLFDIQQI